MKRYHKGIKHMNRTIEQRIRSLEEMVADIHAVLILGKPPAPLDAEQWRRAYNALLKGDVAPLRLCLERSGGIVPKTETIFPEAAAQRGGSNASRRYRPSASGGDAGRRSANLPTAAIIPVMPPDNKGQRRVV